MSIVCPTVLASDAHDYQTQLARVSKFAKRVQVDISDGIFTPVPTLAIDQLWWPEGLLVDIHVMYQEPSNHIKELIKLKPHMVIVHAEAKGDFLQIAEDLRKHNIKVGVALLQKTSTHIVKPSIGAIDHILIFSGDLGKFGGIVDPSLLSKVTQLKEWNDKLEFGWDGGINADNIKQLVDGGIDVLNVGGYIQKSPEPRASFDKLKQIIQS